MHSLYSSDRLYCVIDYTKSRYFQYMAKKKSTKSTVVETPSRTSREEKLFQNILKSVRQYMQGKSFKSMSEGELLVKLGFPPQHAPLLHEVMDEFLKGKEVELVKGKYQWKASPINTVTGFLHVHPRGFGFLQADDPSLFTQDIFIPKHLTMNAIDGDHVEVLVNTEAVSEKGPEGKVITVLSRGRTHVAGIIRSIERNGDLVAYAPLLGPTQRVIVQPNKKEKLKVGDRIVMKVQEWGDKNTETLCSMSSYLGHISDPTCDIKAAIAEFELRSEFPSHVVEKAQSFGIQVSRKEIAAREDLRDIECFTIDPETAKDFDDAVSLTVDEKGHYHLGVHIADVSHYVHPDSVLDQEAVLRCNSTYFPGNCIPMLPSELSDNLCSLKPNVNRLTVSVLVDFDTDGNMLNYRIARTVIKSMKRFSYHEAKEVLDGKKRSRHFDTLKLMVKLCGLLKRKRYERGSIEFSIPELIVLVDKDGVPYGTEYVEYDITHQLVEEFMLKANEIVATHLNKQGKNITYRIHDEPAEENMRDFALLAGAFGFQLPDKPSNLDLQKLFDEALNTAYGPYLATSYIRRMRLAIYSPDNIGHYGLSLSHYCHFTSPIRRYVDLVAHRILFGESDDLQELEKISQKASEKERISAKAENSVTLLKKLRYLKKLYEEDSYKQYDAVISRIKNFGFFFEIMDLMIEGFLHISEIGDDYYIFDEDNMRLRGRSSGTTYCAGDKITVMLQDVDLIFLETKWNFVAGEEKEERVSDRRTERRGVPKGKGKGKAIPERRPFVSPRAPPASVLRKASIAKKKPSASKSKSKKSKPPPHRKKK